MPADGRTPLVVEGHGKDLRRFVADAAAMPDHQQHLARQRSPSSHPDRTGQRGRYIQPLDGRANGHRLIVAPGLRTRWASGLGRARPLQRTVRTDLPRYAG